MPDGGDGFVGRCEVLEPDAFLRDLFTSIGSGHLAKDIDAPMP